MTAPEDFAVFILTHGRADRVITYEMLRKAGYTGPIHIIIDNEDDQGDEYRKRYGDEVEVFDKAKIARTVDTGDQQRGVKAATVVFARNACAEIVKRLGYRWYMQLDDDYNRFSHRVNIGGELRNISTTRLDAIIQAYIEFLEETGALTVAFAQAGDFISGVGHGGFFQRGLARKAMNSFIIRADRPVEFLGRVNEDTTSYVVFGNRGELFFTHTGFQLNQLTTQTNAGGMTDVYLEFGTYLKSFYTVMMAPSCVVITPMGIAQRIHHRVLWKHAVPQIMSESHRKPRDAEPTAA
jgi:hypothetical protein